MFNRLRPALFASIAWACTAASAAETSTPVEWKPGWNAQVIESYARGCTSGFVDDTRRLRSQNKMAALTGAELTSLRDAAQPMCKCITERLATIGSYEEVQAHYTEHLLKLVHEANAGGPCSRPVSEGFAVMRALLE